MRLLESILLVTFLCLCGPAAAAAVSDVPVVAAAADLKFALEETAAQFRSATGRDVKLVFGSSGNFYRQILQGASFQLFLSADESLVFKLAEGGKAEDRGRMYATGRIVLFARHDSALKL